GVVAPRRGQESEADPNRVYYECSQEARTILLRSLHEADAQQIAESLQSHVSRYIEQIHGRTITSRPSCPTRTATTNCPIAPSHSPSSASRCSACQPTKRACSSWSTTSASSSRRATRSGQ